MVTNLTGSCPVSKTRSTNVSSRFPCNDELALATACRDGDLDAQNELYQRHCQHVYRLMYRLVGPDHADDLTQQVFVRVLQAIGQFRGQSALSTWLYRLATNEALQFLRRNSRRVTQSLDVDPVDQRASESDRLDEREVLERALADLEPDLRAIFLLRELDQRSYYEIALALDIAEGTVASRLNRARRQLCERISSNH